MAHAGEPYRTRTALGGSRCRNNNSTQPNTMSSMRMQPNRMRLGSMRLMSMPLGSMPLGSMQFICRFSRS